MRLLAELKDEEFEYKGTNTIRNIVRAIVLDENDNIAIHHLYGVMGEEFGFRDYYETPGGGVDPNETLEEAIKRECFEELGYEVEIIQEIGEIDDFYNLLKRKNLNHYYLCKRKGEQKPVHFVSNGDKLIIKTLWVDIDEAKELYDTHRNTPLAKLVYNREHRILIEVETILKNLR